MFDDDILKTLETMCSFISDNILNTLKVSHILNCAGGEREGSSCCFFGLRGFLIIKWDFPGLIFFLQDVTFILQLWCLNFESDILKEKNPS